MNRRRAVPLPGAGLGTPHTPRHGSRPRAFRKARHRPRLKARRLALNAVATLVFLVTVFPVFWMVSTAIKPNGEIFTTSPHWVPSQPTLSHFRTVLSGVLTPGIGYGTLLRNSLIVALATVLIGSVLGLLAAVAVVRFRFRLRAAFLVLLLVVQMVPQEALLIPLFLQAKRLDLLNELTGLIVLYVGFSLPFTIWMLRGFVAAVPRELEEAAAIDGASSRTVFWRILFPLVAPGLVATGIFAFITAWNEFVIAFTFNFLDQSKYTLPVALEFYFGRGGNEWGAIMAASTLLTVPVAVFFLIVQRRMVSGLVAGAVKG